MLRNTKKTSLGPLNLGTGLSTSHHKLVLLGSWSTLASYLVLHGVLYFILPIKNSCGQATSFPRVFGQATVFIPIPSTADWLLIFFQI